MKWWSVFFVFFSEQLVSVLPASSRTVCYCRWCSASLAIVYGFNEFHCCCELHPPIGLLSTQPAGIEIIDVLNGGQQAGGVGLEGREREKKLLLHGAKKRQGWAQIFTAA